MPNLAGPTEGPLRPSGSSTALKAAAASHSLEDSWRGTAPGEGVGPRREHSSWCQHVGIRLLPRCCVHQDGQGHLREKGAAREGFLEEGAAELRLKGEEEPAGEWGTLGQKAAKAQLRALADFWNTEEPRIVEGT